MRSDKGLSWISWVACEGSAAVDLAPSPQVHTHTHVLTHSNINSRLFAAHAEMHASANMVTHNTVDAKETPLGASASSTTWQSVLPYGHYGFAGQLGKGKLAGGAVTILTVRLNHQLVATTGRLECGVCLCATSSSSCGDFHRHTGRRRLLVLLASRVPEEVVSRTCVVCPSCLRPPFSITLIFRHVRACLKVTVAS